MLVLIKGAGDIASGIALRLFHCGFRIVMTDLEKPTSIRRTVCFSEALANGTATVEDVTAYIASNPKETLDITERGYIAVIADENAECVKALCPDVVVDAILAKRNINTRIDHAPIVIGVGPGFTANVDCNAVIETNRGHSLGRVILSGSAEPNTGVPGNIGGYTTQRVIRAPKAGTFREVASIGDSVTANQTVAYVDDVPVMAQIGGILRGLLPTGTQVHAGMKSGDVDPRCVREHCFLVSDKALSVGGGVLEAILMLRRKP